MKPNRIFAISCCGLGVVAFSQLLMAGMAIASRLESSQKIKIVEREVEKLVPHVVHAPPPSSSGQPRKDPTTSLWNETGSLSIPDTPPALSEPTQLVAPPIADPRTELLVNEAKTARVAADMGKAIVKLEEALLQSPNEPNALYEMGLVHETMGVYEKASDYYLQVFELGIQKSGKLYIDAGNKLRDGFEQPEEMRGKIALGRPKIFKKPETNDGKIIIISIPIIKAPNEDVNPSDIEVAVTFFNKSSKGDIVRAEDKSWANESWPSLPIDWAAGEETLRVTYQIPKLDLQTTHLFGELEYYGQVVTLTYKGEIIDLQAWPRDLAAKMGQTAPNPNNANSFPEFLDQDSLPPNFDPTIPLLNPLPAE